MFVAYLLIFILRLCVGDKTMLEENKTHLTTCIHNIILHWSKKGSDITYVDLNYKDNDILKNIHCMNFITVISRTTNIKVNHQNKAYIVMIENFITFRNQFMYLKQEDNWTPNAYFIIVFKEYEPETLTELFNILLRFHIYDVAITYAMDNSSIYTYNPFQNKSCGKTFQEIIHYDNCSQTNIAKLYFYKGENRLKGCTFNVASFNWPPFTIDPKKDNIVKSNGIEQYLMQIIGKLEGFSLNYTYLKIAEEFPVIDDNMTATGGLGLIQKGNTDIMLGGMLLIPKRAYAFSYFYGYNDYNDEIITLVKKAGPVPIWKNIYLEFTYPVWILLLLTFIAYFGVFTILFRLKDKCYLILVMWDLLFLHGHRLRLKFKVECFLFQWVIFAFLINTYYQSNLTGLTQVSREYQISNIKDLQNFKIQPCINPLIKIYVKAVTGRELFKETNKNCDSLLNSVTVVSKDYTKYTIVLRSIYKFHELKYKDKFGKSLLYLFPTPESKIIYAVYFYKGFPKMRQMYKYAIRLRETGLIDKHIRDLNYEIGKTYVIPKKDYQARFILPWHVLVIGYGLSAVTLVIELVTDYIKRKRMNGLVYLE